MTTKLLPIGTSLEEQTNQSFFDLLYDDGMVTFLTISTLLFDEWHRMYSDIWEEKTQFSLDNVKDVGIHRDDELYDNGSENNYTIVVEHDFFSPKMVRSKIKDLNEKYGTDFEIPENETYTIETDTELK